MNKGTPENRSSYFQFSRRERRGIYALLACIVIVFSAPAWLTYIIPPKHPSNPIPWNDLPIAVVDDSPKQYTAYKRPFADHDADEDDDYEPAGNHPSAPLFYFDPNTVTEAGWERLGIRPKTIHTIMNYRSKGGRFKNPEDLGKIFGLSPKDVQRLKPYVRIAEQPQPERPFTGYTRKEYPSTNKPVMLDINTADTSQWKLLPGIGSGYAKRIVGFRDKLGGFYSVQQVAETRGLPDSVFQKIKSRLEYNEAPLQKININTATVETLSMHPYISKNLANNIVQYRNQHGPYQSIGDLGKLVLVTNDIWLKINPYLRTE